jgi:glutaredoxin-dependent peroxiredoxin
MTLKKGDKAPNFSLPDADRKMHSLSDLLTKKTIIASIPGAFTPVCTKELCTFRDVYSDLEKLGAQVVILAVDSPFVNKAYSEANQVTYPILSDYTRETVKAYGGVHENFIGLIGYSS